MSVARLRDHVDTQQTAEVVSVSPELAAAWLEHNTDNRNIAPRRVELYAGLMKSGAWRANNQGIGFDKDGRLVDGQHRLSAVVLSGCTVPMLVVRNMEPAVARTIDRGYSRTVAEILRREGRVPNPTRVSAWVSATHVMHEGHAIAGTPDNVDVYYDENKASVDWAVSIFPDGTRLRAAGLWAALVFAHRRMPAVTERFAAQLVEGEGLTRGDPAYTLREYVINRALTTGVKASHDLSLKTLRALIAFAQGVSLPRLVAAESALEHFAKLLPAHPPAKPPAAR